MSTLSLILLISVGISLFCSLLILAAGMASSRSHQVLTRSSAPHSTYQANNLMASDLQKLQNNHLTGSNRVVTNH